MSAAALKPPTRTRRRSRKRRRPFRLLLRIAAVAAALVVFWFGYLLWQINSYRLPDPLPKADAAILLGAALWDDVPSPGLKERLDYALQLYKQGSFGHMILTGGQDSNGSTITEAEGMRDYLVARGVPKDRLVLEKEARSTYENLLFSKPLAADRGWKRLVIVTHDYHAPRAEDIARYLDYSDTTVLGFKSQVLPVAKNQFREMLAFTKWKLDSVLLRFGLHTTDAF